MRERGAGRIVNISSMGGKLTFPGGGVYHATKHAVEALSDALRFEVAGFGIQVVVVEPGLIKTSFADAAVGSMAANEPEGPYADFNRKIGEATAGAYEGGLARLGGGPDTVARKIEKAITARRPRTRYKVTPSAGLSMASRRLMTDRMWDRFVGTQMPRPG
jgi:short-subunit dehydrogenase